MRSSSNSQSKIESVNGTWSVYIVYNSDRSKVYVGTTRDLKDRIRKHNNRILSDDEQAYTWSPVIAITGFFTNKEAQEFETNVKMLAKKKEFTEYASLYSGRCPPLVLKRIIAIRCLLCEFDFCWKAPRGKKRRYVLHWGRYMYNDQRQTEVLMNCPWARVGRYVKHRKMILSDDRPLAPETDSSNVSVISTSEHTNSEKGKMVEKDDDDDDENDDNDDDDDDDDDDNGDDVNED